MKRARRKNPRHGLDRTARRADARLLRKIRKSPWPNENGCFVFVRWRRSANQRGAELSQLRSARRLAEAGKVYVVPTRWDTFAPRELWVTESWKSRQFYLASELFGRRKNGLEP